MQDVPPSWHGSAEALYWGVGPTPSYAVRCCTAPAEADALVDDAEAEKRAAEDLKQAAEDFLALFATVGHHLALVTDRAADGDVVEMSEVTRTLRNLAP